MKYDIIIAGAGAAGLMAMKELTGAGYSVCCLEAAANAGGRIATIRKDELNECFEAGAEFIHGDLPLTLRLLNEAGISYTATDGEMISVKKGVWHDDEEHDTHWPQFISQLKKIREDITIRSFLEKHFASSEFADLRRDVQQFAEGFDLADISKASLLALGEEWQHMNERQYRIDDGYGKLINYLAEKCEQANGTFFFNACVTKIDHKKDHVVAHTLTGDAYTASKIIVTASVGVLQAGAIRFEPELPVYTHAVQQLGFGSVIKFLLYFKTRFWKDHPVPIGFLLSDEEIPTWWTQLPIQNNLLTGWLGGPIAAARSNENDESLLSSALLSLSNIFHRPLADLRTDLVFHQIICWHSDPFIKGGYSYETVESAEAKKVLLRPVNDTIYFAGEAIYAGDLQGTVEAALQSGKSVADLIKTAKVEKA